MKRIAVSIAVWLVAFAGLAVITWFSVLDVRGNLRELLTVMAVASSVASAYTYFTYTDTGRKE